MTFRFVLVSILVQRKFTTDRYVVYKWSGCKFTADRYAVYKWLGCKFSPSPKGEGLFPYFDRKDGTNEGNRPHYYCFEDTNTGIYWMIPLSSRVEKYRRIVEKKEKSGRSCDILHIVKSDDSRESVFLIQDMFPITEKYIEREYTIAGNHLMLTSEHTAKVIKQKARKVLGMLKRGMKFMPTQSDVLSILEKLKQNGAVYGKREIYFNR